MIVPILLATFLAGAATSLVAQPLILAPQLHIPETALQRPADPERPKVEPDTMSLSEAKILLKKQPKSWDVKGVTAPSCNSRDKACREAKKECQAAEAFAKKHKAPAVCSPAYGETTVTVLKSE